MIKNQSSSSKCCAGHECDNCKKCASGRCCRTDNPHYKLPELGDWNGVVHGKLGIFNNDVDGKAECHGCGELFSHLGMHVWNAHNLTSDEYRAIFGLKAKTGLIGANLKRLRQMNVEHLKRYQEKSAEILRNFTPEQRKYNRPKISLEEKLSPGFLQQRKKAVAQSALVSKQRAKKRAIFVDCEVCGKNFKRKSSQRFVRHYYCSRDCYYVSAELSDRGKKMSRVNFKHF